MAPKGKKIVYLSEALHHQLKYSAVKNRRSLTAELNAAVIGYLNWDTWRLTVKKVPAPQISADDVERAMTQCG